MNTILAKYPTRAAGNDCYIHSTNFPLHRVDIFDSLYKNQTMSYELKDTLYCCVIFIRLGGWFR